MTITESVRVLFLSALSMGVVWGLYILYRKQESFSLALQELHRQELTRKEYEVTPIPPLPPKAPAILEKMASHQQSWSNLQTVVKDTVVQIFAQKAVPDILQPYKTPTPCQGCGSGFFINEEGELITNAHVIEQAKSVWIQIPSLGKQQIDVAIIGVSPDRDLALLKVKPEGIEIIKKEIGSIKYLKLGDSDCVHRADEIMELGYPLGQQSLKSATGVVSGREQHLIQVTVPINPGNSGGPSLNLQGEVIGINTMFALDAQNVCYIIPINELKIVLDDLRKVKLLKRPFLGVLFNNASEALTQFLGNPLPGGLYVVDIYKDSPLHKAGVQKRDMIYEINGHKIDLYGELLWHEDKISIVDYVAQMKLGQEIKLVVYRQGVRKEFTFAFDQSEFLPIHKIHPGYEEIEYEIVGGMVIQPLTTNHLPLLVSIAPGLMRYAEMKSQMEPALVITHIFPDSQAQRSRSLIPGGILSEINGIRVKTLEELRNALFKSFDTGVVTIETTESVFVVVPFKKIIEDEQRLSKDYFYPLTQGVKAVIEKFDKENGNRQQQASDVSGK